MPVAMELARIIISEINDQQVIYLKEVDGPRMFPILIGIFEATSIDRRVKGFEAPRPLTHDLLVSAVESLGGRLSGRGDQRAPRAHLLRQTPRPARGRTGGNRRPPQRRDRRGRHLRPAAADLRVGGRAQRRAGGASVVGVVGHDESMGDRLQVGRRGRRRERLCIMPARRRTHTSAPPGPPWPFSAATTMFTRTSLVLTISTLISASVSALNIRMPTPVWLRMPMPVTVRIATAGS